MGFTENFHKVWNQDKAIYIAFITIAVLFYPTGLFHELGHYLTGTNSGSSCEFFWWLQITCTPVPDQRLLYYASGGIFGMIACLFLFIIKWVRSNRGIFLGVCTLSFDHGTNAVFETLAHNLYLTNDLFGLLMGFQTLIFMLLLWRVLDRRDKKNDLTTC